MTMQTTRPRFPHTLARFLRDERATMAIEYALIASAISIAIVGVATSLGSTLATDYFGKVEEALR